MGWTKTGEDIREAIDERMRDDERGYYGDIYINSSPDYPSRKFSSTIASCVSTTDTALRGRKLTTSTCRLNTLTTLSKTSAKMTSQKSNLGSSKSGYIQRDYEHYGIEIYFYCRPSESILAELKGNGWHWHRQKKCWFRKYSTMNRIFAEKIIEK